MSAESKALAARTRLIRHTDAEIRSLLKQAAAEIGKILAGQPTDYQAWYLPQIQKQIAAALGRWGDEAADAAGNGQRSAWRGGTNLVDDVLTEAIDDGAPVLRAVLPVLDDGQLRAMTSFLTSKIREVTVGAADAINTELGLVVMGAKSPWDAIKATQAVLEESTTKRAGTIVRTELARAYSTASQGRMAQWQADVPGLQKKWLKSGKLHPREHHVLMDGQTRAVDKPFALPGGGDIMYPHDPQAPASETINCGCCAVPVVPGWKSMVPAKPEDDNHKGVPIADVLAKQENRDLVTAAYWNGRDITISGSFTRGGPKARAALPAMMGAPDGSKVYVKTAKSRVSIELQHPWLSSPRTVFYGSDGILHWESFFLRDDAPEGAGTRMAAMSLQQAARFGFKEAQLTAWGPPHYNGHYTWPRLGFNATFTEQEQGKINAAGFQAKTVRELMASPEGRSWWQKYGWKKSMAFDLRKGSTDLEYLLAYLVEKGVVL